MSQNQQQVESCINQMARVGARTTADVEQFHNMLNPFTDLKGKAI